MKKSRLHQSALKYAAKGIPVFPTCADDATVPAAELKKPKYGLTGGFKVATTDAAQIDAWWTENPNFNIGASPHAAGCCVVDVDAPEAVTAIELEHGRLPATFTVQTPRGGFHFWFKGELGPTTGKLALKVDTRGIGSYVLLPPSTIHGVPYKVIDKTPPVPVPATIPAFLEALAAKSKATGIAAPDHDLDAPMALQRGREVARSWEYADWGTIDDTTFANCAELADLGLSSEAIYEIVVKEWYDRLGVKGDLERLHTVAWSATKNRQNAAGVWAVEDPAKTFANFVGLIFSSPDGKIGLTKFEPLTEAEMEGLPPPTWLIPDVLPAKQLVMLYAPSKGWKTFLALDWAMTIAAGIDKWGQVEGGPVVYIAAEGATGLGKVRRPAWRMLHGIERPVPFHIVTTMPHVAKQQELVELCEAIKKKVGKPRLLIIDTLARFMAGLDESGTKDASSTIELLEMLRRELDCTILALHHTGKDASRGERGSSALKAGFDSGFELLADKDSGTATVWARWHKDAETPNAPWNLKAEKVLDSLVFRMASAEDMPIKDRLTPSDVGLVLRDMKVFSADNAVPEPVVVTAISMMKNWHEKKTRAAFKSLLKTGRLTAYEVAPGGPFYFTEPPTAEDAF